MTISAIIQARMGSSRLPNKVLMEIIGKPVLWHVVNRVSKTRLIDKCIVASTDNPRDQAILDYCKGNFIEVFQGSENDVLDRFYQCAKKYHIEHIVRITADCPLLDPEIIDRVIGDYLKEKCDYASNTGEMTFPDGYDVEIFSFKALEEAWNHAKLPSEREHVTSYIKKNGKFKKINVYANNKYPIYRCSLDEYVDYQFIKRIYEGIGRDVFSIDDVINYLSNHPELLKINQHITINEGYLKSLKEDEVFLNRRGDKE